MKIGIISQWFAPEPFPLPNSLSAQLIAAGDNVDVLTGFPSYPYGRIYDGYTQENGFQEKIGEARVHRVRSFLSHDSNAVNRIRTFLSYAVSSTKRSTVLADSDVNYVYATPMTAAAAAWWCKKRHGVPFVLHIQDLWPESVTSSGMLSKGPVAAVAGALISVFLKPIYSAASHIVVISPSMRSTLINRGVDGGKITKIFNWDPNPVQLDERDSPALPSNERVRFVYAGNLGVMQDVTTILEAARLLRDDSRVEVHIYGTGVLDQTLRDEATSANLTNVIFHGRVAREMMPAIYAESDFQLVTLKDDPLFRMTIPSKFQAAMAHGVPVVSTVQGDLQELLQDAGVGWSARPEDPESLAVAMRQAAELTHEERQEKIQNCRKLFRDELSPGKGIAAVEAILKDVAILRRRNGS